MTTTFEFDCLIITVISIAFWSFLFWICKMTKKQSILVVLLFIIGSFSSIAVKTIDQNDHGTKAIIEFEDSEEGEPLFSVLD